MKSITPGEFARLQGATLIDVREPEELAEVRVDDAVPMPMSTLQEHLGELPEGPLFIMCRSGARSARVTQFLEQQGWDATNIEGGILEWEAEGLPVRRG
ncbi:rhodanese-like domain-containing protein [Pseudolysinimonas sp.]|uniref:rhodanese-like domain-containing protein n=1 Tax=Pseudolysinimonas sp. TaxID=2680009 RepID=UPI003F7F0AA4